ncbi:MAG TPA: hypothetical protein ENK43_06990 [Planctomycetes bacterium]|nr:hypothetical protein [Planctomycetota bacterium]
MNKSSLYGLALVVLLICCGVGCTAKDEANPNSPNEVEDSSSKTASDTESKGESKPVASPSKTKQGAGGLIDDLMRRPGAAKKSDALDLAGVKLTGDKAADKAVLVKALENLKAEWKRTKAEYRKLTDAKVPAGDVRMKALKTKNEMLGMQAEALQTLLDKLAESGR